jgi:hypothetical protein
MDNFHLVEGCEALVRLTGEWISRASTVDWHPAYGAEGEQGLFKLVLVAIVVKQHESLQTILALTKNEEGFSAIPLLRAMCEEVIWVRYLATVTKEEQASIISGLASVGLFETFAAQDGYVVPNFDFVGGWKEQAAASSAASADTLKTIFRRQGFQLRNNATVPSVWQLAKKADMESTYKFLYHATSRAVHFSVPELLRRIWGRPGSMKISSQTFERYWAAFSLYWGGWLYSLTFAESLLIVQEPDIPDETLIAFQEAALKIKSRGAIPILTREEVYWPDGWVPEAQTPRQSTDRN